MKANRKTNTGPERRLQGSLTARGLKFTKHGTVRTHDRHTVVDVLFRTERVAVFLDGCFWHACPWHGSKPRRNRWYWRAKFQRNRARDRETSRALRDEGWQVLRIWEHVPPQAAADRVCEAIESLGLRAGGA